jgi:hypothetical protein
MLTNNYFLVKSSASIGFTLPKIYQYARWQNVPITKIVVKKFNL